MMHSIRRIRWLTVLRYDAIYWLVALIFPVALLVIFLTNS